MASEEQGNRENGSTTFTNDEMTSMIREGRSSGPESEVDRYVDESEREPEVSRSDDIDAADDFRGNRREEVSERSEGIDPRDKALNVIDKLTDENRQLRTSRTIDREPEVEFAEFAPGIRLPKDPTTWPIKLNDDIMRALNIDPGENSSMTKALNILGNALFMGVVDATSRSTASVVENVAREKDVQKAHFNAFFNTFDDLRDAGDIVNREEQLARQRGLHERGLTDAQYGTEIAMRSRARIAQLRGQSLDEYMQRLPQLRERNKRLQGSNVSERPGGRARFGGNGARVAPSNRRVSANEAEFNDMFNLR